jgi:hypothetical protein
MITRFALERKVDALRAMTLRQLTQVELNARTYARKQDLVRLAERRSKLRNDLEAARLKGDKAKIAALNKELELLDGPVAAPAPSSVKTESWKDRQIRLNRELSSKRQREEREAHQAELVETQRHGGPGRSPVKRVKIGPAPAHVAGPSRAGGVDAVIAEMDLDIDLDI